MANRILQYIHHPTIKIFISEYHTRPGDELWDTIKSNIDSANLFLVFISNNSLVSQAVMQEVGYAVRAQKRIIPIVIEKDVKPPAMINSIRYVDFTRDSNKAISELQSIVQELKTSKENRDGILLIGAILLGLKLLESRD